ncbi:MFS transporter [Agrococcus versicolor]|uniref:MFS transporter n=1 Tax=Agrococcus versicolor TaxID=501482 RepID=A0ABN3AJT5_9MICO
MRELVRWRNAVFAVFFAMGFGFASIAARFPTARDMLDISVDQLGLALLGISVGSIAGLATASHVVARLGTRVVMVVGLTIFASGLTVAGWGIEARSIPLLIGGLLVTGLSTGITDVAMNLSGAANERAIGRAIMPVFHAFFSFGTVAGAGFGALGEATGLGIGPQTTIALVGVVVLALLVRRHLVEQPVQPGDHVGFRERLSVWTDARTWLIGGLVLGMALTEGSANDWLTLLMVDGHGFDQVSAALAFALFLTAMTAGRLAGVPLIERFGRVAMLRATAALAAVGLVLVIVVDSQAVALVGTALWGLGASLGFPIGMSAAADDPRMATARVGAVATIGYVAFLAGPPLLGFLGEHLGLRPAMWVVLAFVVLSLATSAVAREPRTASGAPDPAAEVRP